MSFLQALVTVLQLYSFVLLARIVMSWFSASPANPIVDVLIRLTEPVLEPVRRIIPSWGSIDISPLVVFFAIRLLQLFLQDLATRI